MEIVEVLGRLGAQEQNAKRTTEGLYVFVWTVPWHWEKCCDQPTLKTISDQISKTLGIARTAVWPQGVFYLAAKPWVLNSAAELQLPDLGRKVTGKRA